MFTKHQDYSHKYSMYFLLSEASRWNVNKRRRTNKSAN